MLCLQTTMMIAVGLAAGATASTASLRGLQATATAVGVEQMCNAVSLSTPCAWVCLHVHSLFVVSRGLSLEKDQDTINAHPHNTHTPQTELDLRLDTLTGMGECGMFWGNFSERIGTDAFKALGLEEQTNVRFPFPKIQPTHSFTRSNPLLAMTNQFTHPRLSSPFFFLPSHPIPSPPLHLPTHPPAHPTNTTGTGSLLPHLLRRGVQQGGD